MDSAAVIAAATEIQQQAAAPSASAWVSASAGSGKTKVLAQRVLALLMAGHLPHRILCLTFTKAAAAEMSNRIGKILARWVTLPDETLERELEEYLGRIATLSDVNRARRLFAELLDAPIGLRIQTIHAFCQGLLKRFPLEAGVAPVFELLDESEADELLHESWEAIVAHASDDSELTAALSTVVALVHETNFEALLAALTSSRAKIEAMLSDGVANAVANLNRTLGVLPEETRAAVISAACDNSALPLLDLKRAAAALAKGSKGDVARAEAMQAWLSDAGRRFENFDTYARVFLTKEDEIKDDKNLATQAVWKKEPQILEIMQAEARRILAVVEKINAIETASNSKALIVLADRILGQYRAVKQRRSALDYDDLIAATRKLLSADGVNAWVLYKLDGGIDHVLIDEAQDTNPEQWSIIAALTGEFFAGHGRHEDGARSGVHRTVFGVGDPKQSIYSFQGADPEGFARMEVEFRGKVEASGGLWRTLPMNVSFRSSPAVLDAVDAVFATAPARDGVVADAAVIKHLSSRIGQAGLIEIWPPFEPEDDDDYTAWKPPVEPIRGQSADRRLARQIAHRIRRMIDSGERLDSENRAIRAGDVLVLVQRRTAFVEELIRRLKELSVPVAGADRMKLTEQIAVMDLIALGRAALLPDDDLTLAAVLKSPLFGLDDDDLFALAHGRGASSLWAVLRQTPRFASTAKWLQDLMNRADMLSPFAFFDHVLTGCDGRRRLLQRLGPDSADPLNEFLSAALNYQRTHAPSLQGFLHWIERAEPEIKRDLEEGGANAVRVMTCHGAKGLEAPIVFLPDTIHTPTVKHSVFWDERQGRPVMVWAAPSAKRDARTHALRERDRANQDREYRRLLYVAMTRARDRLYVTGWRTRNAIRPDCWHALIADALSGSCEHIEDAALGMTILRLTTPQAAPGAGRKVSDGSADVPALPKWVRDAPGPEPDPPRPLTPSRPARQDPAPQSPIGEDRTRRFQRGLVVHRLLQTLPDLLPSRRRAAAEQYVGRSLAHVAINVRQQTVDETLRVLETSAFASLFGEGSAAEVPLVGAVGKFCISGQVDRLVVTATEVTIVDYKTNRPPPHDVANVDPAYVFQMAAYRAVLAAIWPERQVRCLLLWTDGPFIMELPTAALDVAAASLANNPAAA